MSSYYDHNAKGVSWDVLPFPAPIEVTERQLTDAEAEAFRKGVQSWIEMQNAFSSASCSPADAG